MAERKPLSKKSRFEVFKRDEFTCQYCGAKPPEVILHVDHIVPVVEGGGNEAHNLITSCQSCNLGKGATSLSSVPKALKVRAAEIEEQELQIAEYGKLMKKKKQRIEKDAWRIVSILEGIKNPTSYGREDFRSIKNFLERLPFADVEEAVNMTFDRGFSGNRGFKYFCGICWSVIREGWK